MTLFSGGKVMKNTASFLGVYVGVKDLKMVEK